MNSTIKSFVAEIASLFGKDFDVTFKRQIESSIIGFRATLLRQEYEKYKRFPQGSVDSICLKLTQVAASECCLNDEVECMVMRTEEKVPSPIRISSRTEPFMFVGTSNMERAFTHIQPEEYKNIIEGTKYMKNFIFYALYNDYIYTMGYEGGKLSIRDPFSNPSELINLKDCDGNPCATEIYIEEDLKKVIRQMVIEDYRAIGFLPATKEVPLNDTQS